MIFSATLKCMHRLSWYFNSVIHVSMSHWNFCDISVLSYVCMDVANLCATVSVITLFFLWRTLSMCRWRTKQNLDYTYSMMYARSRGTYYVQVMKHCVCAQKFTRQRVQLWRMCLQWSSNDITRSTGVIVVVTCVTKLWASLQIAMSSLLSLSYCSMEETQTPHHKTYKY